MIVINNYDQPHFHASLIRESLAENMTKYISSIIMLFKMTQLSPFFAFKGSNNCQPRFHARSITWHTKQKMRTKTEKKCLHSIPDRLEHFYEVFRKAIVDNVFLVSFSCRLTRADSNSHKSTPVRWKVPTTILEFLMVYWTQLNHLFAFFTKSPRIYTCSLTIWALKWICVGWLLIKLK